MGSYYVRYPVEFGVQFPAGVVGGENTFVNCTFVTGPPTSKQQTFLEAIEDHLRMKAAREQREKERRYGT